VAFLEIGRNTPGISESSARKEMRRLLITMRLRPSLHLGVVWQGLCSARIQA